LPNTTTKPGDFILQVPENDTYEEDEPDPMVVMLWYFIDDDSQEVRILHAWRGRRSGATG
jgi:hypothetical protein